MVVVVDLAFLFIGSGPLTDHGPRLAFRLRVIGHAAKAERPAAGIAAAAAGDG